MAWNGRQRLRGGLGLVVVTALVSIAVWLVAAEREPGPTATASATWADEATCQACHPSQVQAWQRSHHHLAMQPATDETVLGDFDDATLATDVETIRLFRKDGGHWLGTTGADGQPEEHQITHTFGQEPLQQYLIRLADGRLQAHGAAWDVPNQRWFHLYDGEGVDHRHRLHWTGPQQNADFMCIECHTTGFRRDYDPAGDTFDSQWQALGVGCQSCHGPASNHLRWAAAPAGGDKGFSHGLADRGDPDEVATCARCHSRRTPLGNDPVHGGELLDDYLPMILTADLYEVDGKILDEVFEYGSFVQSRMYQAGLTCSDCHDPHSGDPRADGDAVCTQCHNQAATPIRDGVDGAGLQARRYDDPAHHGHAPGSPGSRCTSCHMPGRVYMGNDLRRDHSFSSPHPQQALELKTSDACLGCHEGEANEVVAAFERWYPGVKPRDGGYARDLHAARHHAPGAEEALLGQLARQDLPDIRRATLVAELPAHPSPATQRALLEALGHASPLVRRTAVEQIEGLIPAQHQARLLLPLADDPVRAVRLAAAWQLLQLPPAPGEDPQLRLSRIAEYEQVQHTMLDRAESHYNLAGIYEATGRQALVEPALREALRREPAFFPARILLAQWREQVEGDGTGAMRLLQEAIDSHPAEASLWHALGLMQVRLGQREAALQALRKAHELAPGRPTYAYVLAVALHDSGAPEEALALLRAAVERHPTHRPLREVLAAYLRAGGETDTVAAD